jgi:hypothetical protein
MPNETEPAEFTCSVCGEAFADADDLAAHVRAEGLLE